MSHNKQDKREAKTITVAFLKPNPDDNFQCNNATIYPRPLQFATKSWYSGSQGGGLNENFARKTQWASIFYSCYSIFSQNNPLLSKSH